MQELVCVAVDGFKEALQGFFEGAHPQQPPRRSGVTSHQLAAQLPLCPCPLLACPLEMHSWSLCLMLFQINVCFSWPKALASYGVPLWTECPADKPQSISPPSSFRRTKQTSLESSEEALSRVEGTISTVSIIRFFSPTEKRHEVG